MPFVELPVELKDQVFSLLAPPDLRALCLAHTSLRFAAEPRLYSTIEWTWEASNKLISTPPISQFLQTILRQPHLGNHVRRLICNRESFYCSPYSGKLPPKIPMDRSTADDAIHYIAKLQVPFGPLWTQELQAGTMDACITLLLLQLLNLTHLALHSSFTKETRILGMLLRFLLLNSHDSDKLSAFSNLRHVTYLYRVDITSGLESRMIRNTSDVLPLFYLSSLEHMAISISNPSTFSWPHTAPRSLANLTSLDLGVIREGCLGHILKVTESLTSLCWRWLFNDCDDGPFNSSTMDFDQIFADLSHIRTTLTTLTIKGINLAYPPGGDLVPITTQGSRRLLRDFLNLRTLTCPQFFLLGFPGSLTDRLGDTLPLNIEHFTLSDDMSFMDDMIFHDRALLQALRDWLISPRLSTPKIHTFNLLLHESDIEWGPEMRQEVRDLCAKARVNVGITKLQKDIVSMFAEQDAAIPLSTWEYRWL